MLSAGSLALDGAYFGRGSRDIYLDNVVCSGMESSLLQCRTNPIGQHNCDHSEDAGVRCEGTQDKYILQTHYVNTLAIVTGLHESVLLQSGSCSLLNPSILTVNF